MLESISHNDVASMLGFASTKHDGKKLEVVVLNGCKSEGLGKVRHIVHQNPLWLVSCLCIEADQTHPAPNRVCSGHLQRRRPDSRLLEHRCGR